MGSIVEMAPPGHSEVGRVNRREFSILATTGIGDFAIGPLEKLPFVDTAGSAMAPAAWPGGAYRRLLMDTHVPDWDPAFLALYNPADFIRSAAAAEFQSVMQYANSHVGLCLWPTDIGQRHAALKGRDFFGETVRECRRRNLRVIAYYSLIFDNWAYQSHPDWRIVAEDGRSHSWNKRIGTVCPNSPYAKHAQSVLEELIGSYAVDGVFLDMTFWPEVCYCPHCEARFRDEQRAPLPRIVDWGDQNWRLFQMSRQAWLLQFAKDITQTIKGTRPITVTHQCSTIFHDWRAGVPLEIRDACDYVGGDFYGGPAQYSLACKVFNSLTRSRPFEFHTSRTIGLGDFETTKSLHELTVSSFVATLHSAACLFIDAVKPNGEFNHFAYQMMGSVNELRKPFEPFLGGRLLANIAVYYDRDSFYDPAQVGESPVHIKGGVPHLKGMTGVARTLSRAHLPFGMVTNATLGELVAYDIVILSSVLELTPDKADIFRGFVRDGGILIATGTSSVRRDSGGESRFLLEDVLGVEYAGMMGTSFSYLTPLRGRERDLIYPQEAVSYEGPMVKAKALPGTVVVATATLPWVSPEEGTAENDRFAQIWSNPPAAKAGTDPGITVNRYGKGTAIWMAAPIEIRQEEVNSKLLVSLLKDAFEGQFWFRADAHSSIEITLFDQPDRGTLLLGLLNMEPGDSPIALPATVSVKAPKGKRIVSAIRLPDKTSLEMSQLGDYVSVTLKPFTVVDMAQLKYE
jgi:hypothetical protein